MGPNHHSQSVKSAKMLMQFDSTLANSGYPAQSLGKLTKLFFSRSDGGSTYSNGTNCDALISFHEES